MSKTPPSGSSTTRSTPTVRRWWRKGSLMARSNPSSLELGAPDNRSLLRGDTLRITSMRGLRQIAYGMMAITLAIALTRAGLSPTTIGLLISVSLAGDLVGTMLIGRWADHWGRRRTLIALALLMAATGLIFGLAGFFDLAGWYPVLLVVAFFGTLGLPPPRPRPFFHRAACSARWKRSGENAALCEL